MNCFRMNSYLSKLPINRASFFKEPLPLRTV